MGYYADGSGYVDFRNPLSDVQVERLKNVLNDGFFEYDLDCGRNHTGVSLWSGDKYRTEMAEETLNSMIPFDIQRGEVEFAGEDREYWRFIWIETHGKGKWVEQSGHIEYDE